MMKKGLSLIESLISLIILLVGVMGLFSAFSQSIYQANAARNNTTAMLIASSFIEELRARPYEEWSTQSLDTLAAQFESDFEGDGDGDTFFTISAESFQVGNSLEGYTQVTVRVDWLDGESLEEMQDAGFGSDLTNGYVMEAVIGSLTSNNPYGESGSEVGGS